MKLINNKPFINLEEHIDLTSFDALMPDIFKGLVTSRTMAQIGNPDVVPESLYLDTDRDNYKPLCEAVREYRNLPESHPIKEDSKDFLKNQLSFYLKYALGGYDLYVTYHYNLFEEHFSSLYQWVNDLTKKGIFEKISDAYIMTVEAGGISFDHKHEPINKDDENELSEFIHIRPNLDRPFYVRNSQTLEKHYINSRVAYWNDQNRHGGDPVMKNTFSLRIDGKFTEAFRSKILQ